MDILNFELPYPPSINHYYIRSARGVVLGVKGKNYRHEVAMLLHKHRNCYQADKRLAVTINVFQPDRRKRDLDNIAKATLDALQHARIYDDDNQIDMLTIIRRQVVKGGCLQVWVSECSLSE